MIASAGLELFISAKLIIWFNFPLKPSLYFQSTSEVSRVLAKSYHFP